MIWSCSAKKEGPKVRFMKNVTAHYNIYFNANELLKESELTIKKSLEDDFNLVLEIFPIPNEESSANETGNLNEVIKKANTIAVDKFESNWLDDSYLLLAKAEYLKGDFYNAVEYYSYVGTTFPKEKKNKLAAYLGQVKSDFALNNMVEADSVLKLAVKLDYKYFKEEVEAAQAQLALRNDDVKEAILHLEKAVSLTRNSYNKIRWRYILAQLQELNDEPDEAYINYLKIAKSNASFEMSFNANLASIRISENADGKRFDKIATLKKLLKEDKNREFKEQIYYQIAIAYSELKQFDKAITYFQTSAHTVPGTVKQKGLSFLKLAQLNFESLKNYTQAQLYYDSTLQYLPKNYPDYKNIVIKANNLQYLADRLTIIETQKNLLQLANLTDKEIDEKVDELFKEKQNALAAQPSTLNNVSTNNTATLNSSRPVGNFYFYNAAALSQGLNEFKKRWGNRKLADNWRISANSLANDIAKNPINNNSTNAGATISINRDSLKSDFLKTLPYSPGAKQSANSKISTALYEIAIFYKDVLKDNFEAAEALEALIINYPNDVNAASMYYQLYRLLESTDKNRSENFKSQLLQKYPNSVFAKTISDPNFGKDEELSDEKIKLYYTSLYELYQQRKYNQVLQQITLLQDSLGSFKKLDPQFAYLKALALGNTQKLPPFLASLNAIVIKYPENTEITPLVKQQIAFITSNRSVFDQRPTALLAYDGNEQLAKGQEEILIIPKVEQPQPLVVNPLKAEAKKAVDDKPVSTTNTKPVELAPQKIEAKKDLVDQPVIVVAKKPVELVPEKKEAEVFTPEKPKGLIFDVNTRQRHFIVIDITDPKVNIAQPFSRLSQYFYSKFDPSKVNLVIRVIGQTDKFIIVSGDFYAKADADKVANELERDLPKIMEGQAAKYIKFVVSETNLKLLSTREAIEQYVKSISEKK